ncbi:MAG: 4'-phosphopantetheinyl transferase superfamily protein [Deltaproteobacteria bacterium]|nr:4'-phosphopantetheinyl transferase superfamily protein [Deltaproteobacteria bacterium]
MKVIYPVILAVPETDRRLRGRDKVIRLSALARHAVWLSASQSGIKLGELIKSPEGVPLPVDAYFWSLAHKTEYVAGVVADFPIGIDIEKIRPCAPGLYRMTADEAEWKLGEAAGDLLFFRYWTAKEAVLKSVGIGLKALSKCRVIAVLDEHHLMLSYNHQEFDVEHFYFNGHIAAILAHPAIRWMVQDIPDHVVSGT